MRICSAVEPEFTAHLGNSAINFQEEWKERVLWGRLMLAHVKAAWLGRLVLALGICFGYFLFCIIVILATPDAKISRRKIENSGQTNAQTVRTTKQMQAINDSKIDLKTADAVQLRFLEVAFSVSLDELAEVVHAVRADPPLADGGAPTTIETVVVVWVDAGEGVGKIRSDHDRRRGIIPSSNICC